MRNDAEAGRQICLRDPEKTNLVGLECFLHGVVFSKVKILGRIQIVEYLQYLPKL